MTTATEKQPWRYRLASALFSALFFLLGYVIFKAIGEVISSKEWVEASILTIFFIMFNFVGAIFARFSMMGY